MKLLVMFDAGKGTDPSVSFDSAMPTRVSEIRIARGKALVLDQAGNTLIGNAEEWSDGPEADHGRVQASIQQFFGCEADEPDVQMVGGITKGSVMLMFNPGMDRHPTVWVNGQRRTDVAEVVLSRSQCVLRSKDGEALLPDTEHAMGGEWARVEADVLRYFGEVED